MKSELFIVNSEKRPWSFTNKLFRRCPRRRARGIAGQTRCLFQTEYLLSQDRFLPLRYPGLGSNCFEIFDLIG